MLYKHYVAERYDFLRDQSFIGLVFFMDTIRLKSYKMSKEANNSPMSKKVCCSQHNNFYNGFSC